MNCPAVSWRESNVTSRSSKTLQFVRKVSPKFNLPQASSPLAVSLFFSVSFSFFWGGVGVTSGSEIPPGLFTLPQYRRLIWVFFSLFFNVVKQIEQREKKTRKRRWKEIKTLPNYFCNFLVLNIKRSGFPAVSSRRKTS